VDKITVVQIPTPSHPPRVRLTYGFFQNLRRSISWPLIALFFLTVWFQADGKPWVLFSLDKRTFVLWGNELAWQNLPLLAGILIAAAFLLFLVAVIWGRVWCGFACPQSIWTWIFIRIEHWTEGPPKARHPHSPFLNRSLKHLLWLTIAFATAFTFTGYFVPIRELFSQLLSGSVAGSTLMWLTVMTALTYLNAGFVREKICLHACPYSRFQSVMFDEHTKTVTYDAKRGEPRARKRDQNTSSGDCVDCALCVKVCPTGIDIREGLQAACIDCGACIDACNQVMSKIHKPLGLIRFTSEAQLNQQPTGLFRARMLGYSALFSAAFIWVLIGFFSIDSLTIEVKRDRQSLFTRAADDNVCNHYLIKVNAEGSMDEAAMLTVNSSFEHTLIGKREINLATDANEWWPYQVCQQGVNTSISPIEFRITTQDLSAIKSTTFIAKGI
jgi:cytochrome c oxidase accessory protein FixG